MRSRKIRRIVVGVIIVFVLGAIYLLSTYKLHSYGNTAANFMEDMWVAKHGDCVYFIDKGINKLNVDGTVQKLVSAPEGHDCEAVTYINVVGGWIYYLENKENTAWKIMKIREDGSNLKEIYATNNRINSMEVIDHKIYMDMTNHADEIYTINTEGKKLHREECPGLARLYMQSIRISGEGDTDWRVSNKYEVRHGRIFGNWLYVYRNAKKGDIDNCRLYRASKDGELEEHIADQVLGFNITDSGIYYIQKQKDGKEYICYMNEDGSNPRKLNETGYEKANCINIVGNKLFFRASKDKKGYRSYWMNLDGSSLQEIKTE